MALDVSQATVRAGPGLANTAHARFLSQEAGVWDDGWHQRVLKNSVLHPFWHRRVTRIERSNHV